MIKRVIQDVRDIGSNLRLAQESGRTTGEAVVSELTQTGILSIFLDNKDNTNRYDILLGVDVVIEAASIDPSYGWLLMAFGLAISNCSRYLPEEARTRLFSEGVPIIAGQYQPRGRAFKSEGGYTLSGNWMFGSGIEQAQWVMVGFLIVEDERVILNSDGKPLIKVGVVQAKAFTINQGSWDVMGLENTRSFDFSCREIFVPEEYCFDFNLACTQKNAHQQLSLLDSAYTIHGAWAVGAGIGILEAFKFDAKHIIRANESSSLATQTGIAEGYGRALAGLLSARALINELIKSSTDNAFREYQSEPSDIFQISGTFATDQAVAATDFVMRYIGTSGIRGASKIQRFLRDIHTGRQHMMVSQRNYQSIADSLLRC